MKATDLMIGDWVYIPPIAVNRIEYFTKVTGIGKDVILFNKESGYDNVSLERVNPIPLTAEILEKNGWVFNDVPFIDGWEFMGLTIHDWSISCGINISMNVRYVHELQHALRLCGLNELADSLKV